MVQFPTRVQHIETGEPVSASVAGRPDRALQAQTGYLKELFESIEAGKALFRRGVTIDSTVEVGQPVYWNATNARYEAARAATETDTSTGVLNAASSSEVAGILYQKGASADVGDIAMVGLVQFDSLSSAISGDVTTGWHYLSATTAGMLEPQKPAITVPVCYVYAPTDACDTSIWVFIFPQLHGFLEDHVHYQIELAAVPAGTHSVPDFGDQHSITDPDASIKGWLPASHSSFNGKAPAGAKFGYNLAAHPELSRVWPPVPIDACLLEMFETNGALTMEGMGRVIPELVRFTQHGIWWMSDCYGEVPWPRDYTSGATSSDSSESSESTGDSCPTSTSMRLTLSFIKMTFATDKTVVTSLQSEDDQPFEFVDCDGNIANTGDLYARLKLAFFVDTDEYYGGQVIKELVSDYKFGRGWVAEGIVSNSENLTLSGSHQRYRTPGDSSTDVVHQGIVSVTFDADPTDKELVPLVMQLGDALQREYRNALYIGLPNGRASAIRMRFNLPYAGLPTNPKFKLRTHLLAVATGTFPTVTAAYYRLARPTSGSPVELTEGDTTLSGYDASISVTANYTYEIESDEITVAAGDVLFVDIARAADATPAYGNDVGFLRCSGIITGS